LAKIKRVDFKKLGEIMKGQGRIRKWLAEGLGVSEVMLSYWFTGSREMPAKYIPEIAKALGIRKGQFTV